MTMDRADEILNTLTLEEKVRLLSGKGLWQTQDIAEKGVPAVWVADGSNGLRVLRSVKGGKAQPTSEFLKVTDLTQDSPDIGTQLNAVCFPSGSNLAASWDPGLIEETGRAIGKECNYYKVHILLAPAINIKRSPLGGRGYEYYSEDPYLTGKAAEAFINGVQSTGTGTSIKHFAANNSETLRINISSDVDERALREIYLTPFEIAVKGARPWTVMSSYNPVNGVQMAENRHLLTEVLRDEWGFEGVVMSDWGGVKDRVKALEAGNDLDMPENQRNNREVLEAVRSGRLSQSVVDSSVRRLIALALKAKEQESFTDTVSFEEHRRVSERMAEESLVLLKNEDSLLPLSKAKYSRIAVLGRFAESPRYQGGGCTLVNPISVESPLKWIIAKAQEEGIEIAYAPGYGTRSESSEELLREAEEKAASADIALVFAGLWTAYDREGFDRKHLRLDPSHDELIRRVAAVQGNTAVILSNGDAVEMPWLESVKAVLEAFLPGETAGEAVSRVLFGDVNPSGKLPVTFPKRLEDTPSYPFFPGEGRHQVYGEGILVGYRYYEKKRIEPLFPFGHGLSYTSFSYSSLRTDKEEYTDGEEINVWVDITNTGRVKGKEVVQIYLTDEESSLLRPEKELKAFCKVELMPGETRTVGFTLQSRALSFYDPERGGWQKETGTFLIHAARSSGDVRESVRIFYRETHPRYRRLRLDSQHAELFENPRAKELYVSFLIRKGILKADETERYIPLLKGNYMGLYNVLTSLLGADVTKEELEALLEEINKDT